MLKPKPFLLCISSNLSIAIVLSGTPIHAEDQLPPSSNSTPKLNQEYVHSAEALKQSASLLPQPVSIESRNLAAVEPAFPHTAIAQTETPTSPPSEPFSRTTSDRWQYSVEPYFFVPLSVKADATVAGRSASINLG
ncbi:hypothetical protein [Myxacorys almedinensis]|uniref:hypothetical protein n=1 Tax=Myxacorys almedinensis TaxID=2651157 RepID=UPI00192EA0A6|nr:hypothetical protein [Myxacorys almedinensis]